MKFVVEQLGKAGERAGQLDLVYGHGTATPFPLLLTKGGCVPHLTRETMDLLNIGKHPLLVPFQHHARQKKVLGKWEGGLASFIGMPDHPIVLTVQDPGETTKSGYHNNNSISVWSNNNRELILPSTYMEAVEHIQPSVFLALCDGDTEPGCSNKRISKSVSKSLDFLDTCLGAKNSTTGVVGALEGGLDVKARLKSTKEVVAKGVDGFLLDGFHCNGPDSEKLNFLSVKSVLAEVMPLLPSDKPRFYFGASTPVLVFQMVMEGLDVFDTSYPFLVTERDSALVFPNVWDNDTVTSPHPPEGSNTTPPPEGTLEINLACPSNRLSFNPLVAGCNCYTCRNFTRAYIHHLISVKEMLGRVLLQLHNLHHYITFFSSLQVAIRQDQVEEFRTFVLGSNGKISTEP